VNTGEFDYLNVHWYFVNDLNWAAIEAAHRLDLGVFIISPNDKGGKLYEPSQKMVDLCAPLSPMVFNDLYCLGRKEVHTLSCGVNKPGDFDEHVRRTEILRPDCRDDCAGGKAAARGKWNVCWARIGARGGLRACRIT